MVVVVVYEVWHRRELYSDDEIMMLLFDDDMELSTDCDDGDG